MLIPPLYQPRYIPITQIVQQATKAWTRAHVKSQFWTGLQNPDKTQHWSKPKPKMLSSLNGPISHLPEFCLCSEWWMGKGHDTYLPKNSSTRQELMARIRVEARHRLAPCIRRPQDPRPIQICPGYSWRWQPYRPLGTPHCRIWCAGYQKVNGGVSRGNHAPLGCSFMVAIDSSFQFWDLELTKLDDLC
jgi:hypothetical protein